MALYLITGISLLVYLILSWFLCKLIGLGESDFYILFGGLAVIGIIAAAVIVWWRLRNQGEEPLPAEAAGEGPSNDEISLLVKDAEAKLTASKLAQGGIAGLPLVYVIGEQGSTKTSV